MRKGADSGFDGNIRFFDDNSLQAKFAVVQVKSGGVNALQIRGRKAIVGGEKATIGVFITMEEPTRPMVQAAVVAGFYVPESFPDCKRPKIQILTVKDLLDGRRPEYPTAAVIIFRKAKRYQKSEGERRSFAH